MRCCTASCLLELARRAEGNAQGSSWAGVPERIRISSTCLLRPFPSSIVSLARPPHPTIQRANVLAGPAALARPAPSFKARRWSAAPLLLLPSCQLQLPAIRAQHQYAPALCERRCVRLAGSGGCAASKPGCKPSCSHMPSTPPSLPRRCPSTPRLTSTPAARSSPRLT